MHIARKRHKILENVTKSVEFADPLFDRCDPLDFADHEKGTSK